MSPEQWQWPPSFDDAYVPSGEYWFPRRETMPAEQRDELIIERIRDVMTYAWERAPFYRRKWAAAGLEPSDIETFDDFERVPVVTKAELRQAQQDAPLFGDYLCVAADEIGHIHGTSGTTGRSTVFGIGSHDWRAIANAHARIMWSMGIRPSDTVFIGSFFSLYMGSWGALAGAERLGARAFPFGAGAPGQTARAVSWLRQMRPSVFYGTPSYALHIAETASSMGVDPLSLGIERMFFSGEPGASIPSIRSRIESLYGALVFDSGSMAEMSPWMHLCESSGRTGMLCWQDIVYTEVCDPAGYARVPYGREGTPVYTHLERTSQPMIRLLSGDLTRWESGPSPCGRTYPMLPRGIYGRIDDMLVIRGENVYPSAIDEVCNTLDNYGGEHRIIVTRDGALDEIAVHIEHASALQDAVGWAASASDKLRQVLGVRVGVTAMAPGTLERTEFKARRVIDQREELRG